MPLFDEYIKDGTPSVGDDNIEHTDAGQHEDAINLMKRFFDTQFYTDFAR